jgi:uncharacterized protein
VRQRLDILTLGVPDVAAARRFYVEGLGWEPTLDLPGEIVFLQVGHGMLLGLWDAAKLEADAGDTTPPTPPPSPPGPVTLSHNVGSEEEVAEVLARAQAAGARILKPAGPAPFGGVYGFFADPSGVRWEVAWNPGWRVEPDGRARLDAAADG